MGNGTGGAPAEPAKAPNAYEKAERVYTQYLEKSDNLRERAPEQIAEIHKLNIGLNPNFYDLSSKDKKKLLSAEETLQKYGDKILDTLRPAVAKILLEKGEVSEVGEVWMSEQLGLNKSAVYSNLRTQIRKDNNAPTAIMQGFANQALSQIGRNINTYIDSEADAQYKLNPKKGVNPDVEAAKLREEWEKKRDKDLESILKSN